MSGGPPLCLLVHLEARGMSGNEVQSLVVAEGLRRRGHRVIVACRRGSGVDRRAAEMGLPRRYEGPRGDADLPGALRLAWMLRRERVDRVLLTSWKRAFTQGWAARRAGVRGVVLRVGGVHRVGPGWHAWKYRRALSRYVDALIANSRAVADHLATLLPEERRARIHLVPNGISTAPAPPAPLREELDLGDAPLLVAVGELSRRKGYDVLLRALARMERGDAHLAVAGEGAQADALRTLARELGVAGRVHFLGRRGDVSAVLAAADAFVSASRSEGMAVALLEAMAAGLPAVATDVGGVREALAPREGRGAAGWIVPPEDPPALARTLDEVLAAGAAEDPGVRGRVAEAEWRMRHWFTVDAMVDGVEAVLREAADAR